MSGSGKKDFMRRPLTASLLFNTPVCLSIACILMTSSPADAKATHKKAAVLASLQPTADVSLPIVPFSADAFVDTNQTTTSVQTALPRTKKRLIDISFIYACGATKRAIANFLVQPKKVQPAMATYADTTLLNVYDHSAPIVITVNVKPDADYEVCSSSTPAPQAQHDAAHIEDEEEHNPASVSVETEAAQDKPAMESDAVIAQAENNPAHTSNASVNADEYADAGADDDSTPVDEELAAAIEEMASVDADPASIAVETASAQAGTAVAAALLEPIYSATDNKATPVVSAGPAQSDSGAAASLLAQVDPAVALLEESMGPSVPVVINRSVESFIRYFQTRGRKHFVRWLSRSPAYMSMLQGILRDNGIPTDISYIAFIESGLNPKAKSRAKAVGMWQFIKGTGKKFGLRIDWWIDERMDPEKATLAAAKYFKNLYGEFDSWYLAAAGYNAGEGRVRSAVRKHGTTDFWQLATHKRPLRRETREYVPKYLAAMLIAKDPQGYGFDESELDILAANQYEKVNIPDATDLHVIAEAAGTTAEEIVRLNPELLRWYTPPNYPDYMIKIPIGTKEQFVENFAKIPPQERLVYHTHTVKRGDTLSTIAKKYGTDIKAIAKLNNLKSVKRLKIGETLAIPVPPELAERRKIRAAQTKDRNA